MTPARAAGRRSRRSPPKACACSRWHEAPRRIARRAAVRELAWLGLGRPARPAAADVRQAIDACREAGVRVVMVTGDQPSPHARRRVGGADRRHEATVVLGEKLRSAVTRRRPTARPPRGRDLRPGDARAEAQSDRPPSADGRGRRDDGRRGERRAGAQEGGIGVAMGRRGTQVAREAADMVLGTTPSAASSPRSPRAGSSSATSAPLPSIFFPAT